MILQLYVQYTFEHITYLLLYNKDIKILYHFFSTTTQPLIFFKRVRQHKLFLN